MVRFSNRACLPLLLFGGLVPLHPAVGQAPAPAVPTREEITPTDSGAPAGQAPSRLRVEDQIERAPCPLAEPAYATITVTFSTVEFRNLQGLSAEEMKESWADYAGRAVPVATLCEIRDRAATMLRRRGYVAAVQVPAQRIEKDGIAQFDILLAKLVGIRVLGKAGRSERLIAAQLEKLVEQPYFNSETAERTLLLAGDLPGYDIRLVLRPAGRAPGEVIGEVEVRRRALEIAASVQNYGSRTIGREGGFVQARFNDLLGLGDTTRISLFNSAQLREQTVLQLGEDIAIGTDGLRGQADFVYAWTKPDVANGAFSARTLAATAQLNYPLVRKRTITLRAAGGLDWVDQKLDFGGAPFTRDQLRVLFVRADVDAIDRASMAGAMGYSAQTPKWALRGYAEVRKGLAGLGASPECVAVPAACSAGNVPTSRVTATPDAWLLRAAATFDYRPDPDWTISFAPRMQVASDALFGYEQFSAGNYTVGRGFDPGAIQGDDGAGFNLELRHGSGLPSSAKDLALQPYVFLDSGWTWTRGPTTGPGRDDLQSAGAGLRAQWGSHGRADLTFAVPLSRTALQPSLGPARLLFSISTQLVPW